VCLDTAGDWTKARQVLYHWAAPLTPWPFKELKELPRQWRNL
jgi:hypothetical protein